MESPTTSALIKRKGDDLALMPPPPPLKRIKRPSKVLDEDEYTAALSEIIARDYFPGLLESKAQQEYLAALESDNAAWIEEAGKNLIQVSTPLPPGSRRRSTRNARVDAHSGTPRRFGSVTPAADTPRGWTGGETPASAVGSELPEETVKKTAVDTSSLSLSAFQSRYTSEDNESFNSILDRQNQKRREKHAYLWTPDQRLPSARQIAHRVREAKILAQKAEDEANGKALIPLTVGAVDSRPARPESWRTTKPDNTLVFNAPSIDEHGIQTVAEAREASSKAGPKHVVHANTRFPSRTFVEDPAGPIPPSPSLNTSIIARRDAARAAAPSETEYSGGETPRVNGYSFVDEDEPENIPQHPTTALWPSYRDLLAGQIGDATPNPFKLGATRRREELHHRLVEKVAKKKRLQEAETCRAATPMLGTPKTQGEMTPAARKLMEKIGRTPIRSSPRTEEVWTAVATPRRKAGAAK